LLLLHIIQLKNITLTSLGHLARKLSKVTNQHIMTYFCTQTICTSFSVILLLFATNMVKKCSEQKNRILNTKTWQKDKPAPYDYIFHQNLFNIIFGQFVVFFGQYDWKLFWSKVQVFMLKNSQKLQTNTWWLVFARKPYAHHFRSFYYCFLPIRLKNAQNKITGP